MAIAQVPGLDSVGIYKCLGYVREIMEGDSTEYNLRQAQGGVFEVEIFDPDLARQFWFWALAVQNYSPVWIAPP